MVMLCLLLAGLPAFAQAPSDSDVWTAAIALLRNTSLSGRGELVIVAETIPAREIHRLNDSDPESDLRTALIQRNAAPAVIRNIQLPQKTRLGLNDSMTKPPPAGRPFFDHVNWDSFRKEFPFGMVLRMSRPAFSANGTKAIIYYQATGGFNDSQGSYLIFVKQEGRWVLVASLGNWIT